MNVKIVVNDLKNVKLLDQREIYSYAATKGLVGGVLGAIKGAVLLSVYENTLYVYRANLDNTYGDCFDKIEISGMSDIKAKAGLFGGSFTFIYQNKKYKFKLPSRADNFANHFSNM